MADGNIGKLAPASEASFDFAGTFGADVALEPKATTAKLEELQRLAAARGGQCLASEYAGSHIKHRWRCATGHEWDARPAGVKSGTWCLQCSGKARRTVDDMKALAATRGGEFLSPEYRGSQGRYLWKCADGHVWDAIAATISSGRWCPYCSGMRGTTVETLNAIAATKGGRCLSPVYRRGTDLMEWECATGHRWKTQAQSIKLGKWCPECALVGGSYGERLCRAILEMMFKTEFPKRRPDWLMGSRGGRLELDGYSEAKQIAFEYQGPHHYGILTALHRNTAEQIALNDTLKSKQCFERGVALIKVPMFGRSSDFRGCLDQIEASVLFAGLKIPRHWRRPKQPPNLYQPLEQVFGKARAAALRKAAQGCGGALISTDATTVSQKLRWRCASGHEWERRAESILGGVWCPVCAGREGDLLGKLREIAGQKGGLCLSPDYLGNGIRHQWQCASGHAWWARPNEIKRGHWCRQCANEATRDRQQRAAQVQGHTIGALKAMAKRRGGECLSDQYLGNLRPLRWRCSEGHEWEVAPVGVKRGTWCPECGKHKRSRRTAADLTIDAVHALAKERGGECLSTQYAGVAARYNWRCACGHCWASTLASVRQGRWCPPCGRAAMTRSKRLGIPAIP